MPNVGRAAWPQVCSGGGCRIAAEHVLVWNVTCLFCHLCTRTQGGTGGGEQKNVLTQVERVRPYYMVCKWYRVIYGLRDGYGSVSDVDEKNQS